MSVSSVVISLKIGSRDDKNVCHTSYASLNCPFGERSSPLSGGELSWRFWISLPCSWLRFFPILNAVFFLFFFALLFSHSTTTATGPFLFSFIYKFLSPPQPQGFSQWKHFIQSPHDFKVTWSLINFVKNFGILVAFFPYLSIYLSIYLAFFISISLYSV